MPRLSPVNVARNETDARKIREACTLDITKPAKLRFFVGDRDDVSVQLAAVDDANLTGLAASVKQSNVDSGAGAAGTAFDTPVSFAAAAGVKAIEVASAYIVFAIDTAGTSGKIEVIVWGKERRLAAR